MRVGDEFRVISYIKKKPIASTGKIIEIDSKKITIKKENGFIDSFTIGDLIDKFKKKQIKEEGKWVNVVFEQRGLSVVPVKIIRRSNSSCNAEQSRADSTGGKKE